MITYVDEEVEMTAVEFEHSSDSNDAPSSSSSNNKKKLIIITTALSLVALIAACIGVWSFDSSKKNESDDAAYDDEYDAMSSSSATNSNIQQQYQQVFTSSPTTLSPSLSPVAAPITSMPTTAEPTPQPTPEPTTPQPTPFPSMRPTFAPTPEPTYTGSGIEELSSGKVYTNDWNEGGSDGGGAWPEVNCNGPFTITHVCPSDKITYECDSSGVYVCCTWTNLPNVYVGEYDADEIDLPNYGTCVISHH